MAFDSHLREGIEPGPQTLRLQAEGAGMRGVLPALTVLFIACFIGIPLGVVSVTDSQGVIYATLGALAVVFVVGMWVVARRFRPPASEEAAPFEVVVEQLDVRRGESSRPSTRAGAKRRGRGRRRPDLGAAVRLEMRLDRERYTPGETVRGSVRGRVEVVSEVPAGDESRVGTTA